MIPSDEAEHQPAQEKEHAAALRKRSRILITALAVTAVIAVVAVIAATVGFVQASRANHEKDRLFREATSLRLVAEARSMLAHTRAGGDVRALQSLAAARRLAQTPGDGPLLSVLEEMSDTLKVIETPAVVLSVAFSPDGKRIVSGGGDQDGTVRLWDAATGQPIGQPMAQDRVASVAFSPDGHRIVSGDGDGTVLLWDAGTGQPLGDPFTGHVGSVDAVAFSPDGTRIASGSGDGTVRLWDDTGQPLGQPMGGHTGRVSSVAFSPDGHRIVSGGGDGTVRLWDAGTGQPLGDPFTGHVGSVDTVAYSPDGERIASGGYDDTVRVWPAYPDPAAALCAKITTNMSHQQWRDWVSPDIDYIEACPGLPIPADGSQ